jgi:hypothetical protein
VSEISPLFACSSRRLRDASLLHWREVRHATASNVELAVDLNVHDRKTDSQAGTMKLQWEAIPDAKSLKTTDAATQNTEIIRNALRGMRTTADCTVSTTSAMPLDVDYVERIANTSPDVVVSSTVHLQRR